MLLTVVGRKGRDCVSLCCHAARAGFLRHTTTTQRSRRRTTLTALAASFDRSRQFSDIKKMANAFEEHGVVPDVIDVAPESTAEVVYPSGVKVELGNVLTPTQVKDAPKVTWPTEAGAMYSLIMTDPDAPSRAEPKYREWHHWLVGNISGSDVANGEVLSAYVGSGPPKGSGLHRYCFLVFKQTGKIDFTEKRLSQTSMDGRPNFKAREFAARHNLGNPVAGNFYQAEWDDYVPKLYEQLSGKK